ncbi:MAG: glycosyltransferase family 4 protein [Candidatus Thiodiazotropha sp. (ex Ustalcina ferruginea)]|nr:glycosyltransferase family 4 protein [Candidatus Thiodiazotropha sp. (ex Ustalcina ferruginea)]
MKTPDLHYLFLLREPYPPFRPDTLVLFADELRNRGHEIDWVFQSKEPLAKSYQTTWEGGSAWVAATVRRPGLLAKLHKQLLGIWMDLGIIAKSRQRRYDFIQVRDRFFGAITGLIAAKLGGSRFFFWLSFPFPEMYLYRIESGESPFPRLDRMRGGFLKFLLYRIIMPAADYVFVQSDQMKADVVANGIDAGKIMPVPMGISLKRMGEWLADSDPLSQPESPMVLYLGTLIKDRKLDFLVRVHKKVIERIPDATLYFVGGGQCAEDEKRLLDEARRLGISDSVVLTGFLPVDKAWQYLYQASVCVSPFYPTPILNSTSPTKLVEYMAFGKPVVANDHPDQRNVINDSGAGYCVAWDEDQFADAIVRIINDPDGAEAMGERGKRYVEKYRSYHAIADSLDSIYRDLCSDKPVAMGDNIQS